MILFTMASTQRLSLPLRANSRSVTWSITPALCSPLAVSWTLSQESPICG